MALSIGELFVSLGFDVDDGKLKSFNDQIVSARNEILKVSAAATAAVAAIGEFISTPISRASQFKQFTDQTGYSSQALQEWARTASMVNNTITFDQAMGKYRAFSDYVQKAQFGGGGGALSQLGATFVPGKSPEAYLEELSNVARSGKWQAMYHENWRSAVTQLLSTTGLSADYMDALMTTASQRASMTRGMIMQDGSVNQLDHVNTMVKQLGRDWEKFAQDMTEKYGDKIIDFLQKFEQFVEKLIPQIDNFAQKLGGWMKVGELVLAYFAGTWAIGMLGAIARVSSALLAFSAANTAGLAGVAGGAAGLAGGAGAVAVGAGALGLGAAVPLWLDHEFGWGKKFADWAVPIGGKNVLQRTEDALPDWFLPSMKSGYQEPKVEHLLTQHNNITIYSNGSPQELAAELRRELEAERQKANQKVYNQLNLGAAR